MTTYQFEQALPDTKSVHFEGYTLVDVLRAAADWIDAHPESTVWGQPTVRQWYDNESAYDKASIDLTVVPNF